MDIRKYFSSLNRIPGEGRTDTDHQDNHHKSSSKQEQQLTGIKDTNEKKKKSKIMMDSKAVKSNPVHDAQKEQTVAKTKQRKRTQDRSKKKSKETKKTSNGSNNDRKNKKRKMNSDTEDSGDEPDGHSDSDLEEPIPKHKSKRKKQLVTIEDSDEEPIPKRTNLRAKKNEVKEASKKMAKRHAKVDSDEEPIPKRKTPKKPIASPAKSPSKRIASKIMSMKIEDEESDSMEEPLPKNKTNLKNKVKREGTIKVAKSEIYSLDEEPLPKTKAVKRETPQKDTNGTINKNKQNASIQASKEKTVDLKKTPSKQSSSTSPEKSLITRGPKFLARETIKQKILDNSDTKSYELMLVDKYKPESMKQIIGQQGAASCANKLFKWLKDWYKNIDVKPGFGKFANKDGAGFKAALISGPPGIGKTTTAQIVTKETGFEYLELNASDTRNKKSLQEEMACLLDNQRITNYFSATFTNNTPALSSKHVVIMDEVDGMAGNEDRGGIQELIQLIKKTKIPIICICNDRSHMKMRSLVNYCFDLRFIRPRLEMIKGAMLSLCLKEGIKIKQDTLADIIEASNHDIRQVIHYISLLTNNPGKDDGETKVGSIKDIKLGLWDALRKVFTSDDSMSFIDKSDLFFTDYNLMPLFVFENYIQVSPKEAKAKETARLRLLSKAASSISLGDLIETQIRRNQNWSLLPIEAAFACVIPGSFMEGYLTAMINFPALLGKISSRNKKERLIQELKNHMNLRITGSNLSLNMDYLDSIRTAITLPLIEEGSDGVPEVLDVLHHYFLRREDIESIMELTQWPESEDLMKKIEPKVKAALTRAYNKDGELLPYATTDTKKSRKGATPAADELPEDMELVEDGEAKERSEEMEVEEDDNIEHDAMIVAKKKKDEPKATKASTKAKKSPAKGKKSPSKASKSPSKPSKGKGKKKK